MTPDRASFSPTISPLGEGFSASSTKLQRSMEILSLDETSLWLQEVSPKAACLCLARAMAGTPLAFMSISIPVILTLWIAKWGGRGLTIAVNLLKRLRFSAEDLE